jgi:hypothetical protein
MGKRRFLLNGFTPSSVSSPASYPRRFYLFLTSLFIAGGLLLPIIYFHGAPSPLSPHAADDGSVYFGGSRAEPAFLRGVASADAPFAPPFRGAAAAEASLPLPAAAAPAPVKAPAAAPAATSRALSLGVSGLRPSATSSPAAGSPASAAGCPAPPPYRGVLDPALLTRTLAWVEDPSDGVVRFEHAVPHPKCKKWLTPMQNYEAGAGHRLREWGSALWVATAIRPPQTPVAFAHTAVGKGEGMHGEYAGIDEFLGLAQGEGALEATALIQRGGQREFPCSLEVAVAAPYAPNKEMLKKWTLRMGNLDDCNFVYKAPPNHWAMDHNTGTRGITAWKFAAAAAERAAAGARLPLLPAAAWADPATVHIGLHFRSGDGLLVPEAVLAGIVKTYVLPPLGQELPPGTPLALHVYTNAKDPTAELPALAALRGLRTVPGGSALEVSISGVEVSFRDALWALSQTDVFVGSVSSFSWIVAQFSSRPASLLQSWDDAGEYKWCLEGMGCCDQAGVCDAQARFLMLATAQRLGRMARCGQLNEDSLRDEGRVGAPVATAPEPK